MKNPPHPGLLVKNELEEMGVSIAAAAGALGVTRQALYNVINGKSGITPEMAVRLAKGVGSTAEGWLRMQISFDLAQISPGKIRVTKVGEKAAA